jgi:hypothetical protein
VVDEIYSPGPQPLTDGADAGSHPLTMAAAWIDRLTPPVRCARSIGHQGGRMWSEEP